MNTNDSNRDGNFETRVKRAFDDSVDRLDGHTRSKLALARAKALEARARRRRRLLPDGFGLLPVGAVAAAVLAAVIVWQGPLTPNSAAEVTAELEVIADFDILLGEEDLELFEELEFYAWLQEQPELQELLNAPDSIG